MLSAGDLRLTERRCATAVRFRESRHRASGQHHEQRNADRDCRPDAGRPLEMAAPLLTLVNDASGSLLTAGELSVTGGDLRNAGQWQGKRVLIHAQALRTAVRSVQKIYWMRKSTAPLPGQRAAKSPPMENWRFSTDAGKQRAVDCKTPHAGASTLNNSGEITGVDALWSPLRN